MDFEPFEVEVPVPTPTFTTEAEVFEGFIVLAEAHRDQAVRYGFSPEAAEALAVHLHSGLVARYFTQ